VGECVDVLKKIGRKKIVVDCCTTTTPQPFYGSFSGPPHEPVPEENFWTLGAMEDQQRQKHQPSGWAPLRLD